MTMTMAGGGGGTQDLEHIARLRVGVTWFFDGLRYEKSHQCIEEGVFVDLYQTTGL